MLKVNAVTKKYGDLVAVDSLSFEVSEGEIFGLLGENGAGKSTTFKMIMGLLEPNQGTVTLNDKIITYDIVDSIGYMIEDRALLQKMTVKQLMLHYGALKNLEAHTILERLNDYLSYFKIEDYLNSKIQTLSKGNQQKIQFITAIINHPKLLILDEPFAGLDPINVNLFIECIQTLKDQGTIIIFASHQLDYIESFCEKIVLLKKGKSLLNGKIKDIKNAYEKELILIDGNVEENRIKSIPGVLSVMKTPLDYQVKIENKKVSEQVFEYIKTCKPIYKFEVVQASLAEIFIEKVGEVLE